MECEIILFKILYSIQRKIHDQRIGIFYAQFRFSYSFNISEKVEASKTKTTDMGNLESENAAKLANKSGNRQTILTSHSQSAGIN